MSWLPNFMKIGPNVGFGTKFARIYNFGSRSSVPINIFITSMFDLFWVLNFIKIGNTAILRLNLPELGLLWVPNFIAMEIYFNFGTTFSWNERIDTCFNVGCVLLGRNFDFLVVTAPYLVVTAGYCPLPGGYWCYCSLPLVTARSHF